MADFALVNTGAAPSDRVPPLFDGRAVSLDMYDLPDTDLHQFRAVILPMFTDQEMLLRQKAQIRRFLDDGRILVWSGHLFHPWLPGAGMFRAHKITKATDYTIYPAVPHPIFKNVDLNELTYRKGVAGFFSRGSHQPPPGADVLLTFEDGDPMVYLDRVSSGGTMIVHAGNNLFGYASEKAGDTTLGNQFVRWLDDEFAALQAKKGL